jgi:hypothetical protein
MPVEQTPNATLLGRSRLYTTPHARIPWQSNSGLASGLVSICGEQLGQDVVYPVFTFPTLNPTFKLEEKSVDVAGLD